jgi:hypothetical protein
MKTKLKGRGLRWVVEDSVKFFVWESVWKSLWRFVYYNSETDSVWTSVRRFVCYDSLRDNIKEMSLQR